MYQIRRLNLEALIPISSAISLLFLGFVSDARKHKALTEDDNFVDADIIFIIVTVSVTNIIHFVNQNIMLIIIVLTSNYFN